MSSFFLFLLFYFFPNSFLSCLVEMGDEGGGEGSAKSNTSKRLQLKSKVVEDILEDILESVKRENLGFSEQELRPALKALIKTYGTDDAYKWITKDNFAVLVNYIFELPQMATGESSHPLHAGEFTHRKCHNDQVLVKHSGNATGQAPLVRDVADQERLHSTPFGSKDTQKKHSSGEYLTGGSNKVKKMKFYNDDAGSMPTEHIKKSTLEQNDPISSFSAAQGETNVSSIRMNKLHPDTSPSASSSGRNEHYIPNKVMRGSVRPLNAKASSDTRTSYVEREEEIKTKTSKSYSNASHFKKHDDIYFKSSVVPGVKVKESGINDIAFKSSMVPRVKAKEYSIHRSIHKDYASGTQVHPNHMCETQLSAMNIAGVDEGHKSGSPKLRNNVRQFGEFEMDTKECREGKIGYRNEPQKDYKRYSSGKQISLNEEMNKTSKGHNVRKVKDHNDSMLSVTEGVSIKQKFGNSEGDYVKRAITIGDMDIEQNNNSTNCKNAHEENKTRFRDNRKPSNDKESMPSKEFTNPLKKQQNRKLESSNKEVSLPCGKINTDVPCLFSKKPNKKNAVTSENLSLKETGDIQDHFTIQDSLHGPKELIEEKVSGQFYYSFLQELKIAATGWVKSGNGWSTDMSFEALQFFFEWKKNLDLSKKEALAISNNNRKDYCLHEHGTPKTGKDAQVGRKKATSLSENGNVDGNLLSWDISRGLEKKKIPCFNEYNDIFPPDDFVYITKSLITAGAHVDLTLSRIGDMHCSCSGNCLLSTMPCKCTDSTRGEYAYDRDGLVIPRLATNFCFEEGKMTQARDFITECTPICPCDMQCGNRVVQRGLKYKLQVFMTKEGKGWGVRALEKIAAHSFLFEYIGEIMTNMEQYYRNEEYRDKNIHTYQMLLNADHDMETRHFKDGLNDNEALTLDATRYGNVSRFVNHRCGDPNMFVRPVQIETRDTHYYHVAFFAARDISIMEELTWDYCINFQDKHEVKGFHCLCGSSMCRDSNRKVTRRC